MTRNPAGRHCGPNWGHGYDSAVVFRLLPALREERHAIKGSGKPRPKQQTKSFNLKKGKRK